MRGTPVLKVVETPVIRRRLIKTKDGAELGGTLFLPPLPPRAALVLNGATGVPQTLYKAFAQWVAAERGVAVLTYDYRGMGQSAETGLRACRATMSDWGLRDNSAARSHLRRAVPDVPLWVMGHSLGAMMLPMQEDIDGIDRVIGVGSGLVHYMDHPWPYRGVAMLFWFGFPPLVARMFGYLPGRALGFGADLPTTAFNEWREWCTTPGVFAGAIKQRLPVADWSRSGAPVRLISIADDDLVPRVCTERLAAFYDGKANIESIQPADFGLGKVGHIAAFSRRNKALWDTILGTDLPVFS
ncbi:MAG: alpha/beta fold hydrolase [Paracoccaceae bacterium]|nr:alpha/beta fold hydrolase [Paracoccaceae bacterium]